MKSAYCTKINFQENFPYYLTGMEAVKETLSTVFKSFHERHFCPSDLWLSGFLPLLALCTWKRQITQLRGIRLVK